MKVKVLVDSECTYARIDEQLVKNKRIQTKPINFSFEIYNADGTKNKEVIRICHMQAHLSGNYIPTVILFPNYTSLPSMAATFLTTYLIVVLQLSRYSIFHGRDTSIQLGLL